MLRYSSINLKHGSEPLSIPTRIGKRCNFFRLMSRKNELHAYKGEKSIDSAFIINAADDFVNNKVKEPTLTVLDNAEVYHGKIFKAKINGWKKSKSIYFTYRLAACT